MQTASPGLRSARVTSEPLGVRPARSCALPAPDVVSAVATTQVRTTSRACGVSPTSPNGRAA